MEVSASTWSDGRCFCGSELVTPAGYDWCLDCDAQPLNECDVEGHMVIDATDSDTRAEVA
jgi:hypothetical protein